METPAHNVVGWFEIPVLDMERAINFYEQVFNFKLQRETVEHIDMAWFPWVDNAIGAGGSLVCMPEYYKPSADGTIVYFTAFSGDLAIELERAKTAGGHVIMEKRLITEEIGYMGIFLDTEGNKIALHSK